MARFRRRTLPDVIIDLTEQAPYKPLPARLTWGLPLPCPECHDPGYLDRIDPVGEVMFQHCPTCFCRWETTRSDLESVDSNS